MAIRGSGPEPVSDRIRVLVVDDSALMRRLLCDLLASAPEIEVVGTARNGREAVLEAVRLKPDVVTLDVEMPEVSGLEALPLLLAAHEAPVVMVSALTQEGADVTLQALELGAVDFMPKPERNQLAEMRAGAELLIAKVLTAAQSRVRRARRSPPPSASAPAAAEGARPAATRPPFPPRSRPGAGPGESRGRPRDQPASAPAQPAPGQPCVVIGISTGGPQALSQVLPQVAPPSPPILIVQHMPAQFTGVFSERLNRSCSMTVREAAEGDFVLANQILVAPGGRHMALVGSPPRVRVSISDEASVSGHKPSIDVLFQSAARIYQSVAVGILMTGMGRDGVEGCKAILAAGGFTAGQDEATSVVYGMNKAAYTEGAIRAQFSLDELPGILHDIAAYRQEVEGRKRDR
ncbi:MAG: chemotaxis-specific protein-glutamate methyltransferase CheB [Isosphaeraceae bacterium]